MFLITLLAEEMWLASDERNGYTEYLCDEDEEIAAGIRRATRTGCPFGTGQFIDQMEFSLKQRLRPRAAGRPRKTGKCPWFLNRNLSTAANRSALTSDLGRIISGAGSNSQAISEAADVLFDSRPLTG